MYNIGLAALGDNVVDLYEHTHVSYPGGNAVNVAVYAKRLGAGRAAYMGDFGNDRAADQIISALEAAEVELVRCRELEGESGWSRVSLINGDRTWLGSNNGGIRGRTPWVLDRFDLKYLSQFDLVHTGCYGFMEKELSKLNKAGIPVSFDFSDDASEGYICSVAPGVEYAFISRGQQSEDAIKAELLTIDGYGPKICVATMGERGAIALYQGQFYKQQAQPLENVTDTMGAGDSFIAAFLLELCSQGEKNVLSGSDIQKSLLAGVEFAAKTCSLPGAFGFGQKYQ